MNDLILTRNTRLTDALERDLLLDTMENPSNIQPLVLLKQAGLALIGAFRALASYISEVNDAMNRARADSAHYSGSQW